MIDGLIAGKLQGVPEWRRGKAGSEYVVAKVRAASADGDTVIVNVIVFSADLGAAMMALHDGDAVALAGSITPKVWSDKQGNARAALDMVASRMLSVSD